MFTSDNCYPMKNRIIITCLPLLLSFYLAAQKGNPPGNERSNTTGIFYNSVPEHLYDIILSRPSATAVTISVMCNDELEGYFVYGKNLSSLTGKTQTYRFEKGKPLHTELSALNADTRYYYRFIFSKPGEKTTQQSATGFFHTQRKDGEKFVFTIQADSHLDENSSTDIYKQTLANMAADSADFLVDLGDTWMTDKYRNDFKESLKQYIAQRYYFGLLCHSSPLFLTLGNHDGESGRGGNRPGEENMTSWATATRKTYYANPQPNTFYSGSNDENYYAWEWGNTLFIVLDPFRYTKDQRNPWQRTLGEKQYNWLKETLQKSKASFRFVFIHNLVGGADNKGTGRGGAEAAKFFEWGGFNADSTGGFSANRPGWDKPVHDLLVQYKVNAVFHGHDHLFVKQELDGIVYQTLPQPGAMRYGNINSAKEYGYNSGTVLNAPGYLRVTVEKGKASIEYIQTSIDGKHKNKEILFNYTIATK